MLMGGKNKKKSFEEGEWSKKENKTRETERERYEEETFDER